ncbi:MAG TPA: WYL domain-containing transcriptional regulator, partial [Polyangia bacterium]
MARNDQIVRILSVARALASSRRGVSLTGLAIREGWNWRTVYRDVQALEAAGFPIETVDGRHRLPAGWSMPNLPGIEADEILAFYAVRALAGTWRTTAVGKPLDRLWMKLTSGQRGQGGQGSLLPVMQEPWFAVRSPIAIDYRAHDKIIATFDRAARDRLAVTCCYRALSTKTVTARLLEPGELYWDPTLETLYVIAWCRLRQAVRVFAVHRFVAASLTDETFAPRAAARSAVALKNAFKIWRSENVQTVRIRFDETAAEEIRERTWAPRQRIEEVASGGLVLTMAVAGTSEIERWVLGYGGAAEVLVPEGLRARVAELAGAAA